MKSKALIVTLATLTCASIAFAAGDGGGKLQTKDQTRDRIQTCDPTLENPDCKMQLPEEVKDCVKDMAKERDQYQQKLRVQLKDAATCSEEDRDQLRDRLRDQLKDQACDREQLRDRLCELRECVPTHDEVMEQAKEQAQTQRRGED